MFGWVVGVSIGQTCEVGCQAGPFDQSANATATKTLSAAVLTGTGGGRVWDQTDLRIK